MDKQVAAKATKVKRAQIRTLSVRKNGASTFAIDIFAGKNKVLTLPIGTEDQVREVIWDNITSIPGPVVVQMV